VGPVQSSEVGYDYRRLEERYGRSTLCGEYNYEEIYGSECPGSDCVWPREGPSRAENGK